MRWHSMIRAAALATTLGFATSAAQAADDLTLQLKWVTQAQFAGYYVAKDRGFYADRDLDVTIKPGGPDISPEQVLAAGGADVVVTWMAAALAAREKGVPLVNVGQIFEESGLQLTCLKSAGITSPDDFPGHTIGVWYFGNEYPFLAWMDKLGYATDGGDEGITVLKQGFNVDPLIQGQADCISTMTYNEYWQVIDAGYQPDDLAVFPYSDYGVALLEDGLYADGERLSDPAYADKLARFLKASIEGWAWARDNPDEAAMIVLKYDMSGAQTEKHQKRMMSEVAKLLGNNIGYLHPAHYQRTVDILLSTDSTPVITEEPDDAWTHDIYDAAMDLN